MVESTRWELPEPSAILDVTLDRGIFAKLRRFGNPEGRRMLLSHGNGLAIDAYYPFWSLFEDDCDLFVYDLRNHGWNEVSTHTEHNLLSFVRDLDIILSNIASHFGDKPVAGVFHSLSALIALLTCSDLMRLTLDLKSKGFSALVLFDPPLHRPGKSFEEFDDAVENNARTIRRRTENFVSERQFVELLEFLPAFARVVPGAKELIAETTLRYSSEEGNFRLRCPKAYEARIVEFIRAFASEVNFESLPCPTKVIGSDPLSPYSYLPTVNLSEMLNIDFDFLPETTHLLQIEKPQACASLVRNFLDNL